MQKGITKLLKEKPALKSREIAKLLGLDRAAVSVHLHDNRKLYHQDGNFRWTLLESHTFVIQISGRSSWIAIEQFENALKSSGSPHDSDFINVTIKLPPECKVKLCAAARILALSNQLANAGKKVVLDFTDSREAVSYLNRAGLFDRLNPSIKVLPRRPQSSSAQLFNANSKKLVELHEIGIPGGENVPDRLKQSFIAAAGDAHANVLFSAIGELVSNVEEHAGSDQPGFAGLQCYGESTTRGLQIQTVVSDSGMGICGTLRPILKQKYPELAHEYDDKAPAADPKLVVLAFKKGGISRVDEEGRGLGLRNSGHSMEVLNGKLDIRQENFSVTLRYKDGDITEHWELNLPRILGTHIVFEIHLTGKQKSA